MIFHYSNKDCQTTVNISTEADPYKYPGVCRPFVHMCDLIYHTCPSWAVIISHRLLVEILLIVLFEMPCDYSL